MAFPQTPRRIGVANGAGNSTGNDTHAKTRTVGWTLSYGLIVATADLFSASGLFINRDNVRRTVYFRGGSVKSDELWGIRGEPGYPEIDSSPGGTSDFFKDVGDLLSKPFPIYLHGVLIILHADATVYHNTGCFIPTISALAASSVDPYKETDLYLDLTTETWSSPFTDYFWSSINTPHIFITPEINNWILAKLKIPVAPQLFPQTTQIAAIIRNLDQRDLFAVNNDGRVCTAWSWDADGKWQGWLPIGLQDDLFPPQTLVTAVSSMPEQIDLFAVDAEGHVKTTCRSHNDGLWQEWATIKDLNNIVDPLCSIGAASCRPGRIDLFLVGRDAKVYTAQCDQADGEWSDLARLHTLDYDINLPRGYLIKCLVQKTRHA